MNRLARLLAVCGCALIGISAGSFTAFGATPDTKYVTVANNSPDPENGGRWGERIATAGDLNGDGVNDVFVGDPQATVGTLTAAGRVYAVDGKSLATGTPKVLYRVTSPNAEAGSQFGFFISVIGDINGDGIADLAIGDDSETVNGIKQGRVYVVSGKSGSLIRTITDPDSTQAGARFGSRIGRADQLGDIIVGASNTDSPVACSATSPLPAGCHKAQGRAYIISALTGALIRTLDLPAADQVGGTAGTCSSGCGSFGLAVQGPGDTDSDGVADQVVSAPSLPVDGLAATGRIYVFSNGAVPGEATGQVRLKIDDPIPQAGAFFGFQDAEPLAPGDVNGDGNADIYGDGWQQNGPAGGSQGEAWVFNGKTGAVLYSLADPHPTPGGQFGWSLARTSYRKGATPDLYVGASPHHVEGVPEDGETNVFDGRDGTLLKALPLPAAFSQPGAKGNLGPNLGWTVAAPGDLNGDGEPDYLGGAPFTDVGSNQDQGLVFLFESSVQAAPSPTAAPTPSPTTGVATLAQTGFGPPSGGLTPFGLILLMAGFGSAFLGLAVARQRPKVLG